MNITIPDKIQKLLIAMGIGLFIYGLYKDNRLWDNYDHIYNEYENQLYLVRKMEMLINKDVEDLKTESKGLSQKYNIENQIAVEDSTVVFTRILNGSDSALLATKILGEKWAKYKDDNFLLEQEKLILEQRNTNLIDEKKTREYIQNNEIKLLTISGIVLFFWVY